MSSTQTKLLSLTPIIPTLVSLPQTVLTPTDQERAFQEEQMQQRDIRALKNALHRYKEEPPVPENESARFGAVVRRE
jgi:hypothetical protein